MTLATQGADLTGTARVVPLQTTTADLGDFLALMKPRVMLLVVFTALVGLLTAPGHVDPLVGAVAVLCIAGGAGAAGALNMWYDADIDAVMTRTARRPIPLGRVSRSEALAFGLALAATSIVVMSVAVSPIAAALLAFTIFFYVVVYTMWLKRRTAQNIVIGGAAGAFPPVIGWVAGAGRVGLEPVILFLIILLWPPVPFLMRSEPGVGKPDGPSRLAGEQPTAPCAPIFLVSTWGGPVPRRVAAI
jgi:heme o synthase